MTASRPALTRALRRFLLALAVGVAACTGVTTGASAVTITELPAALPNVSGMALGADGNVWAATAGGLARVNSDGVVTGMFPTPTPSQLTAGPDGSLWFIQPASGGVGTSLGRLTTTGVYTEIPIPTPTATVVALTPGPDGNVWFGENKDNGAAVVRMTPAGLGTEFYVSSNVLGDVATGPDGNLWVGTGPGSITRVTPAGISRPFALAGDAGTLALGPTSPLGWYITRVGYGFGIGRLTFDGAPVSQVFTDGLSAQTDIGDIAIGPDGNGWFSEPAGGRIGRISPQGHITEFTLGGPRGTGLTANKVIRGPGTSIWFSGNAQLGRLMPDLPQALTGQASDITVTSAKLTGTVAPRGAATSVRFEYGPTADYGKSTAAQPLGDGDTSIFVTSIVQDQPPASTIHYRVVASSPVGTVTGEDRTLTTATAAVVTPVAPPLDTDRDGYPDAVDCRPLDAKIHDGAHEVPGNTVDEDCSGRAAPYERFFPHINATFENYGHRYSRFTGLVIERVPSGASLRLTCTGQGCAFRRWSTSTRGAVRNIDLLRRLKRSSLRRGAVLKLALLRSDYIGTIVRWTVRPPPQATITCLWPGKKKEQRCPR